MANIFDVAKYILEKKGQMSTWKLQKLCYYSQAWTLAWGGEQLFDEDFQAWSNGPVCPDLYRQHQGKYMVSDKNFLIGCSTNLTPAQTNNIDIVLGDYGDDDAYQLREQTHSEDPWIVARGETPSGKRSDAIISKESMGEYYGSL